MDFFLDIGGGLDGGEEVAVAQGDFEGVTDLGVVDAAHGGAVEGADAGVAASHDGEGVEEAAAGVEGVEA